MKQNIFTLLLVILCSSLFAQTDNDMKAWMNYMTPGTIHQMLAKYDGEWNEELSMWMSPGTAPQIYKATTKNEMIMGGRYQLSKTSGNMMGMPFEGMSTLGYDNLKKVFTSTWIDNFGTGTLALTGSWDEKSKTINLTGKMVDPMTGNVQDVKQTIQFIDDDDQLIEMFAIVPQGAFKTMSIKVSRKK